uniref:Uncharacterized protein n=1 Tax=Falco tinnunculus TaxID=100819 RepID=A0A8C4U9M1_FALTI
MRLARKKNSLILFATLKLEDLSSLQDHKTSSKVARYQNFISNCITVIPLRLLQVGTYVSRGRLSSFLHDSCRDEEEAPRQPLARSEGMRASPPLLSHPDRATGRQRLKGRRHRSPSRGAGCGR